MVRTTDVTQESAGYGQVAHLRSNIHKELGVVWEPDHPIRMNVIPEAGANVLEVKTTNTWRNRLIGDFSHINEPGKAWTTCPIGIFMDENSEPSPAGFRGPVRLLKYSPVIVELE